MKFFRIIDSFDQKIVGKFPQFKTGYYPVHSTDPRLMLNVFFTKVNESEVFSTVPKLVRGARLTDFMAGTATGNIISERLREIFEQTNPIGLQFIEQKIIIQNEEIGGYWLTNNYEFDYNVIDFAKTEISIMKSVWDEDYRIQIKNSEEFVQLVEQIKLPQNVKIFRPYFLENYEKDFFALRYVYNGFSFFCSQRFREKLEAEKITGIRFMELDEIL
jgi:hypothetical protein